MTKLKLKIDDKDAALIANALRGGYTQTLDALAECAGGGYGGRNWPKRAPNYHQARVLRRQLDRIERLCSDLGYPLSTSRRTSINAYFEREAQAWRYLQNPGAAS